jgi:hypothetical protein
MRQLAEASRPIVALLLAGLLVAVMIPTAATPLASAQALGCIPDPDQNRIEMGTPDGQGNSQHVDLTDPSVVVGFHFTTMQPDSALLYIGDQWYDLDLYLYVRGVCKNQGGWEKLIRAWSVRAERRVIQFMRPNEQIVNLLPGEYLMVAQFNPAGNEPFDPSRGFTARVATASPYCDLDPADQLQPNPAAPSVMVPRRPDESLYQLGLSVDPAKEEDRVPFTLLSFGAFLSPPYSDLFDFSWMFDGQPLPLDASSFLYQIPVEALPQTPGGQHTIKVTAAGVRYYPDPGLTHLPPTLTVSCTFKVAGPQATPATRVGTGTTPTGDTGGTTNPPGARGATSGTGPATRPPTVPPAATNFAPDYDLVSRCKTQFGVTGSYSSKQQFDNVIACYVQATITAGSTQSPAEIEQNIRRALAF